MRRPRMSAPPRRIGGGQGDQPPLTAGCTPAAASTPTDDGLAPDARSSCRDSAAPAGQPDAQPADDASRCDGSCRASARIGLRSLNTRSGMPCANADDAASAKSAAKARDVARFIEYLAR
ncbi:hypothetical protein DP43_5534 [Burkholderia pseudomallei]|nr:hypothetical protein DP43_5534 [Burkholderia pseudomallei]